MVRGGNVFAIVAIPIQDDYVWRISSEKIPHMTLLAFEDPGWTPEELALVSDYIEHAASLMTRFGLSVDRRGELGDKKADVLFFSKEWNFRKVEQFRSNLLANSLINAAARANERFPDWIPHLTLGFPATPAKKDPRDYPGFSWMNFDQIALWTEDSSGPTFRLKSDDALLSDFSMSEESSTAVADILEHFGVKGMKWGVHRNRQTSSDSSDTTRVSALKGGVKTQKTTRHLSNEELEDAIKRMRLEQEFTKLSGGLDKTRTQKAKAYVSKLLGDAGKQATQQTVNNEAKSRFEAAIKAAAAGK